MTRLRAYLRDLLAVMSEHGNGDPFFAITGIPRFKRRNRG